MIKSKAILIFPLIFLLIVSIVYSQPPFEINIEPETIGLQIEFPLIFIFKQNKDIIFNYHVFNFSDLKQVTNATTNCTFHLFDNTGGHLINQLDIPFDVEGQDYEVNISGTNFTRLGEYATLVNCISIWGGGVHDHRFTITADGLAEENIRVRWLFYFAIIFMILLFTIGLAKEDINLIGFSGMLSMIIGVFMLINGFAGLSNLMTNGVGIILIGFGAYIFIRANQEHFEAIF